VFYAMDVCVCVWWGGGGCRSIQQRQSEHETYYLPSSSADVKKTGLCCHGVVFLLLFELLPLCAASK
jgi:hypothetical protein